MNRASPSRSSPARRTRLLSSSDSTTSRRSGSAQTAAALSRFHSPGKTDNRRKAVRSRSESRSWLQAMAARRSRCRSGASRGPLVSTLIRRPSRNASSLGVNTRSRAAASSIASGSPSRPMQISASARAVFGGELDGGRRPVQRAAPRPGCRAAGRDRRRRRPRAWAGAVRRTRARPPAGAVPGWWRAPAAETVERSSSASWSARSESSRCSQLSRTTSRSVEPSPSGREARASSACTWRGSRMGARSTQLTSRSAQTARASLVLPTPGGPVSVTSRARPSRSRTSSTSAALPISEAAGAGGELPLSTSGS